MNKVILMGRLTRDPEIRYGGTDSQMAIASFSMAVDRRMKRAGDSVDADFFNCTSFGKQAEFVERYLKKGTKVVLTGRIQNNNYTNREGQKVYSVQIIAEEIEFAESKNASANAGNGGGYDASYNNNGYNQQNRPNPSHAAFDGGFMNIPDGVDDEELPFH